MSVNYYLISRKAQRRVLVGHNGFSGVRSYPGSPEVIEFIKNAIEAEISDQPWNDIRFVNEHEVHNIMEEDGWLSI